MNQYRITWRSEIGLNEKIDPKAPVPNENKETVSWENAYSAEDALTQFSVRSASRLGFHYSELPAYRFQLEIVDVESF